MPRNGSGTYSLPEAPFVSQTPISSSAMNNDLSDVAAGLTGSLARDGQGGMTAVLPLANGGAAYLSDPDTGLHRIGANEQALFCGGVDVLEATATGINIPGTLTVGGDALIPVGLGPLPWSGLTAPPKWVFTGQALLRASFPALWVFVQNEIANGNTFYTNGNGTTTFTIGDMGGYVPAGRETVATRLTPAYFGADSTVVGANGGLESNTLTLAQLPTGITSVNASQAISVTSTTPKTATGTIQSANVTGGADRVFTNDGANQAIVSSGNNSISVTSNNTSGTGHNNVQPTKIFNFIIFAGA